MFHGPKQYIDDEGASANEYIAIRCETEQVALQGENIAGTVAMYSGPDERLVREGGSLIDGGGLRVGDVIPILREWGHIYEVTDVEKP
jgi:hypothetical protein